MREYLAGLSRLIGPGVMLTADCYNGTCLLFLRTTKESQKEWENRLMTDGCAAFVCIISSLSKVDICS